jgi:hypothetical protein
MIRRPISQRSSQSQEVTSSLFSVECRNILEILFMFCSPRTLFNLRRVNKLLCRFVKEKCYQRTFSGLLVQGNPFGYHSSPCERFIDEKFTEFYYRTSEEFMKYVQGKLEITYSKLCLDEDHNNYKLFNVKSTYNDTLIYSENLIYGVHKIIRSIPSNEYLSPFAGKYSFEEYHFIKGEIIVFSYDHMIINVYRKHGLIMTIDPLEKHIGLPMHVGKPLSFRQKENMKKEIFNCIRFCGTESDNLYIGGLEYLFRKEPYSSL